VDRLEKAAAPQWREDAHARQATASVASTPDARSRCCLSRFELHVSGFGFKVSCFVFCVSGFGFRVGVGVLDGKCRTDHRFSGLGAQVSGFGSQVSSFGLGLGV